MLKTSLVLTLFLAVSMTGASAQTQGNRGTQQEHDACARDVNRYCRKVIEQGDMVILGCLQENRKRLTAACQRVLRQHGV
jgi:hypothetical protein